MTTRGTSIPQVNVSFITLDANAIPGGNNSLLYFRPYNGIRRSTDGSFYALGAAIGNDPSIRLDKYDSNGVIINSGYLYDTSINPPPDTAGPWSVNGSSIYYTGGNVGIGVTNPSAPLDINGSAIIRGDVSMNILDATAGNIFALSSSTIDASAIHTYTMSSTTIDASTINASTISSITIDASYCNISTVDVSAINASTISSITIDASYCNISMMDVSTISSITIDASYCHISTIDVSAINASSISSITIDASYCHISTVDVSAINASTISSMTIDASYCHISTIDVSTINASIGNISTISSTTISTMTIDASYCNITTMDVSSINVSTLTSASDIVAHNNIFTGAEYAYYGGNIQYATIWYNYNDGGYKRFGFPICPTVPPGSAILNTVVPPGWGAGEYNGSVGITLPPLSRFTVFYVSDTGVIQNTSNVPVYYGFAALGMTPPDFTSATDSYQLTALFPY